MNIKMFLATTICIAGTLCHWDIVAQETLTPAPRVSISPPDPNSLLDGEIERIRQSQNEKSREEALAGELQRSRAEIDVLKSTLVKKDKEVLESQETINHQREAMLEQTRQTQAADEESQRRSEREQEALLLAEVAAEKHWASVDEIQSRERKQVEELPPSIPNADPRIDESMTISSNVLHGFSMKELEYSATARLALLSGAESPSKHVSISGFGDYRIGAGDVVEFISLDNEALTRSLTVRYDGTVSLPLIPDVKVEGLTRAEAEELIRTAYGESFLDPVISLSVIAPNSKIFTVIGDIERPGIYNYTREITLTQSLSLAGGRAQQTFGEGNNQFVSVAGQITKAFIVRTIDDDRKVIAYDLRNIDQPGAHDGDAPVYYGDLVYVPKGVNLVYLLGEQSVPRIIEMTDGLTLLQMLALSGGFNESAARLREIVLLRAVDDENTDIHLINLRDVLKNKAQDIPLVAGDIVYIPRKRVLKLQEFVGRFTGTLSPLLGLYQQAVDSYFTYDINKETLELLRDQNSGVTINPSPLTQLPQPLR